ncbi:MAG TPA: ATP-binding cassette domain-containing protein [Acholeplasmataceae bacterium]|nr:ATP-binding cassette domain-containing protein [Acholeplasmataceae bacterium]
MISTNKLTIQMGKDILFEDVSIKFNQGNSYGVIGANGSGKSTFLKVLAKELKPSSGSVFMESDKRLSFLKQDHYAYDEYTVIDTVIMGNNKLYKIMKEKDEIYQKPDFSEEDGIIAGKLEEEFDHLGGWDAEYDAAVLLTGLGIEPNLHYEMMKDLEGPIKVKVLLAQALFGNPDVLLLDEPTNNLDIEAIRWLEEYLINFKNTLIIVSHDRYFLNKVCTHIADIDYKQITLYAGNYDFWYESSQLMLKQAKEANKKAEDKIKELQDFIARFSANASKSRQATSRKKLLDKIEVKDIKPSTRKYPYINFVPKKQLGDDILTVENINKTIDGEVLLKNISFIVGKEDKIAFVGNNEKAKTMLFDIITGSEKDFTGTIKFGETVQPSYFERDHNHFFQQDKPIIDWLGNYSDNLENTYIRGFLGRMLFSGEDSFKSVKVLSGGEKVRCLISKMMIEEANLLILDEPTNHLDMEAITSLNKGLINFNGVVLFSSTDHQLVQTTANRIIEIFDDGTIIDQPMTYDEYLESKIK